MFKDRQDAGIQLARRLQKYKDSEDVVVVGIPCGGVEVAHQIATTLHAPLDIVVVKKIKSIYNEEFALGSVSVDNYVLNNNIVENEMLDDNSIKELIKEKQQEARASYKLLKENKPILELKDKIVILVDNGVATGSTMLMAVQLVKKQRPTKIVVAIAVAAPETFSRIEGEVDEIICLEKPTHFISVAQFYNDFTEVTDEEVRGILKNGR